MNLQYLENLSLCLFNYRNNLLVRDKVSVK